MRLAVWCTSYFAGFGGAEKFVNDLANRFAARGIDTFLIAGKSGSSGSDNPHYARLHPAVRVYRNNFLNAFDYLRRPHLFVLSLFQYLIAAVQVGAYLRRNKVDVVHLHFVSFDVMLLVLYRYLLSYKLVLTFSGSDVHLAARNNLAGLKVRLAIRCADRVTAVSQDLCSKLATVFGCASALHVPSGIDREQLRRLAAEGSTPIDEDHLIYCGRLTAVKRVPFLIEAFFQCLRRGCDRKLYIVGDGEDASRIKALIASYGVEDRIVTLGALTHAQVAIAINRSRCLLLSSSNEGCPLVALESLALGRPVIAPDVGGLKEIVADGVNGYLYPSDRQDLLCDAILKVAGDKSLADSLGAKGPAVVARYYDLNGITDRYCQVYEQLNGRAH